MVRAGGTRVMGIPNKNFLQQLNVIAWELFHPNVGYAINADTITGAIAAGIVQEVAKSKTTFSWLA